MTAARIMSLRLPESMADEIAAVARTDAVRMSEAIREALIELHGDRRWSPYSHLEVFGDGVRALRRAIDAGLLGVLRPVNSREEFANRLLAVGLIDCSDHPLSGSGASETALAESAHGEESAEARGLKRDPPRTSSPSSGPYGVVRSHA